MLMDLPELGVDDTRRLVTFDGVVSSDHRNSRYSLWRL
jgi:hypothetical protein